MARQNFREPDPVEEILRIAMKNSGTADAALRDRLLASAAELGISREEALAAEAEWKEQKAAEQEIVEYRASLFREFTLHGGIYLAVNVVLVLINLLTSRYFWAVWPMLGLGLAMAIHAIVTAVMAKNPSPEEINSWRNRQHHKPRVTVGVHIAAGAKEPGQPVE